MTIETNLTTSIGIAQTVLGSLHVAQGKARGMLHMALGMTAVNIDGRLNGLTPNSHAMLMKSTLGAGTGAIGVQGAFRLKKGVEQKSASETIKGAIQTLIGIAGTAFIYSLDSKMIVLAHQASVVALSGAYVAKLGLYDLVKGRYRSGFCKILFGAGAIASAGYYVYSTCSKTPSSQLTADQMAFLDSHKAEIEEMYANKEPRGDWKDLGRGISKIAFVHPEFPGMLIKIPRDEWGFHGTTGEEDLTINYRNLEEIRNIAAPFDRIVLPDSHLLATSKGLMIVEERFDLVPLHTVQQDVGKQEALAQFQRFKETSDLCDVSIEMGKNTGFIRGGTYPRIAIFDFDCLRIGKKISGINPKKVFQVGLGLGILSGTLVSALEDAQNPGAAMFVTGLALATTSAVSASVMYSWMKNKCRKG